jgi:hypothetical protein
MRIRFGIVVALLTFAVIAAPASAKPKFPKSYKGSATGTRTQSTEGKQLAINWKIDGLKLKRVHIRVRWGISTAFYKVTAGTVQFHAEETGTCSYVVDKSFALKSVIDQNTSAPFTLEPKGSKFKVQGMMSGDDTIPATETCPASDGGPPYTYDRKIAIGTLLEYGSSARATRASAKGKNTVKFDFGPDDPVAVTKFTWDFKS